jgi:hypothetical protein
MRSTAMDRNLNHGPAAMCSDDLEICRFCNHGKIKTFREPLLD